jgi:hypothetical protein
VPKETSVPEEAIGIASPENSLPDQDICNELVELYFDYVHDKFHSLFHRPSLVEDIRRGQAPENLIYGILALSARYAFQLGPSELADSGRFSNHSFFAKTDPRERGKQYAKKCEQLLNLNDVSLTTIQVCVLLGAIAVVDGRNPASETIYYSIACRIAQLLDLPNCRAASHVEQEVNIRGLYLNTSKYQF